MNIRLLGVAAGALVLLGAVCFFWRAGRSDLPSTTESGAQSEGGASLPGGTAALERPETPEGASPAGTTAPARSAAPVAATTPPLGAETALADAPNGPAEVASAIESEGSADPDLFVKKYATSSAEDRKRAREELEALIRAYKEGGAEGGQAPTEEEVVEIYREYEWLRDNPKP